MISSVEVRVFCPQQEVGLHPNTRFFLPPFFGLPVWWFKNHDHQAGPPPSLTCRVTDTIKQNSAWKTIETVKELLSSSVIERPTLLQLMYDILKLLGWNTSQDDLFIQKLQKDLEDGCCYGSSLAFLKAIKQGSDRNELSADEILLLQILSNLQAMLSEKKSKLEENEPTTYSNNPDWKNADELYKKIQSEIEQIVGFSLSKETLVPVKNADFSGVREFCQQTQSGRYLLTLYPGKENEGNAEVDTDKLAHTIVLDLENNGFFDINIGYYSYADKESCLSALFGLIQNFPEYRTNTFWQFIPVEFTSTN